MSMYVKPMSPPGAGVVPSTLCGDRLAAAAMQRAFLSDVHEKTVHGPYKAAPRFAIPDMAAMADIDYMLTHVGILPLDAQLISMVERSRTTAACSPETTSRRSSTSTSDS